MSISLSVFKKQIENDIEDIQSEYLSIDSKLSKPEYAFNYWILTKILHKDISQCSDLVIDYNDAGVDCFAFFEEDKELFLIQNKYYSSDSAISPDSIAYFFEQPLNLLLKGEYSRSIKLQNKFFDCKDDNEWMIHFWYCTTTEKELSNQNQSLIHDFNNSKHDGLSAQIEGRFFNLKELYSLYYGDELKETISFDFDLHTHQGKSYAAVNSEYKLGLPYETYYIITPILEIYRLIENAESKGYQIFDKNIREYLGDKGYNKSILRTLRDPNQRKLFLYFNNGITINCNERVKKEEVAGKHRILRLYQPQIVNGCQTAKSITTVVKEYANVKREEAFKQSYVLVKVLVIPSNDSSDFYKEVVKCTNQQNAIPPKAFVISTQQNFVRLQEAFDNAGLVLSVKQSDKYSFLTKTSEEKRNKYERNKSLRLLFPGVIKENPSFNSDGDLKQIIFDLEKVLQIFLAFFSENSEDAIQHKSDLLKPQSRIFNTYTREMQNLCTFDDIIKLSMFFAYADANKMTGHSDIPVVSPFYVIHFFGRIVRKINGYNNEVLDTVFERCFKSSEDVYDVFDALRKLCISYSVEYKIKYSESGKTDYLNMIKSPLDNSIFESVLSNLKLYNQSLYDKYFKPE